MAAISRSLVVRSLSNRSYAAELRSLAMIMWKEWTIFRRYPSWVIAFLIWPIIFPAAYILSARALAGPDGRGLVIFQQITGSSDYLSFIAIGAMAWMWQNIVLWKLGFTLREDQLRGTLESNWLTPSWRFSFLLGSGITHMGIMLVFLVVSALEFGLVFGVRFNGSLGLAILVMIAAIPSVYGLGFAFASLIITAKEANAFVFLVRGVLMVFCGITFPVSLLPEWMQKVAAWLPQTYLIHGMRAVAAGANFEIVLPDVKALLLFGLFWLIAGYLLFNWMERRARLTGAIGQY